MIIKYESEADASFYCYFIKSGTPFSIHPDVKFTIKAAPHFHRNIELLFITEGEQNVVVDGNNYHLKAGDILFVNSYEPHSYDDCEAEAYVLVLSFTFFEPFVWFHGKEVFPQLMDDKEKNKEIFDFIEKWYNEKNKTKENYEIFIRCNELFDLLTKKYEIREPVLSKQNELVISALKYISDHYCDIDLTLKSCSDAIGYCKEYVSKQFNNIVGVSFKTYVNNLRIKKFKELENNSNAPKQEIARACGFKSVATFYRALRAAEER